MAVVKVQRGSSTGLAWQYVSFCVAAACVQETIPDIFWPRQRVNNLIEKPPNCKEMQLLEMQRRCKVNGLDSPLELEYSLNCDRLHRGRALA